jgi:hypothetical protein
MANAAFIPASAHLFPNGQLLSAAGRLLYVGRMTAVARKIHIPALFLPRRATRFCS